MISVPSYIKIYSAKQILIDKPNSMTEVTLIESYFNQLGLLESFQVSPFSKRYNLNQSALQQMCFILYGYLRTGVIILNEYLYSY